MRFEIRIISCDADGFGNEHSRFRKFNLRRFHLAALAECNGQKETAAEGRQGMHKRDEKNGERERKRKTKHKRHSTTPRTRRVQARRKKRRERKRDSEVTSDCPSCNMRKMAPRNEQIQFSTRTAAHTPCLARLGFGEHDLNLKGQARLSVRLTVSLSQSYLWLGPNEAVLWFFLSVAAGHDTHFQPCVSAGSNPRHSCPGRYRTRCFAGADSRLS